MQQPHPHQDRLIEALRSRGTLRTPRVIEAMRRVPREAFLDADAQAEAHEDTPLPIGEGQTISAPHMVAMMAEALDVQPGHRVLEVGGGSGYHAAVLAHLAAPEGHVLSVERHATLAQRAQASLDALDLPARVEVVVADGSGGVPERAPFDRISVAAGAPALPHPLLDQLASPGRLVLPVGSLQEQSLLLVDKDERGHVVTRDLGAVRFVPLVGAHGWPETP